jgi:hypothetical protein
MYTIQYQDGTQTVTDDKRECCRAATRDGAQVWVTATRQGVYFAG